MARILLLLPTRTYRAPDLMEAAHRLGASITVASEESNVLESRNPSGYLTLDFDDREGACRKVLEFSKKYPLDAVLGVDDATVVAAAAISSALSLPSNSVKAVEISRDKLLMRDCLRRAWVPIPGFVDFSLQDDPIAVSASIRYPCVLKPTMLSASQGVIRADGPKAFVRAWKRISAIIKATRSAPVILVETFVPGMEVALEGLLENGRLKVLSLFDKPDPLDGPYFEETIYLRPSRLPKNIQNEIISCVEKAVKALGLERGPVHAEVRVNKNGPFIIEVAARPIGGRCSKTLRFGLGISLEEVILRQALGQKLNSNWIKPDPFPSGVMMIPTPRAGTLSKVLGLEKAREVAGIVAILITAHPGQKLIPLPEGSRYLGFIFARAQTPAGVEAALRRAHRLLKIEIQPTAAKSERLVLADCNQQ